LKRWRNILDLGRLSEFLHIVAEAYRKHRSAAITLAFLVLLEKLSPEERAVFLLKDIFEYEHTEIAEMLNTSPENSRQLLHRAKARLAAASPRLVGTTASTRRGGTFRTGVFLWEWFGVDGDSHARRRDVERWRR
jgi:DNA-directed RNA polymerase specialized sigma24 family protein